MPENRTFPHHPFTEFASMAWFELVRWWLALMFLGLLGWPLSNPLFAQLPSKGYPFSKGIALLLVSYFVWLGASLHLMPNSSAGVGMALLLVVLMAGVRIWRQQKQDHLTAWRTWWRQNWPLVLMTESLFLLAFVGWAWVRSFNPSLYTGEKRMEFTIINGILNSRWFPPQDPWLAGYNINYYYFGHLMVTVLARMARVDVAVGFNLAVASWFALAVVSFFGVMTDLIRRGQAQAHRARTWALGLLGVLMTLFMGNLTAVYDWFYQRNQIPAAWVRWLNVWAISKNPPAGHWPENDWWWFKGARVLVDYGPLHYRYELFNDFPFIGFLTGDLHAQTFSLPFMPLVIGLAWVAYHRAEPWQWREWPSALLAAILLGGDIVMHPWDAFIIFPLLVAAAMLGHRSQMQQLQLKPLLRTLLGALLPLLTSFILYLPFWLHLQSPGMGVAVNLFTTTRLSHYLILFATFLLPIILFLWLLRGEMSGVLALAAKLFPIIFLLPALFASVVMMVQRSAGTPLLRGYHIRPQVAAAVAQWTPGQLMHWFLIERMSGIWLWLLLAGLLAWTLALTWQRSRSRPHPDGFILLLLILPLASTLLLEFLFIAEPLGIRVNSIFKFYYFAWELYAIIAIYALSRILSWLRSGPRRMVWGLLWLALLLPSLLYAWQALPYGSGHFSGPQTLDSLAYLRRDMPDDMAGIIWLQAHAPPDALILEAHTQNYSISHDALVATITGNPTLVGWWDHELHWHGPEFETVVKGREAACRQIYGAKDAPTLLSLLRQWHVDYFYVGNIERTTYNLTDENFRVYDEALTLMFTQGGVRIYSVP
jgi:YYY domain-containing protein